MFSPHAETNSDMAYVEAIKNHSSARPEIVVFEIGMCGQTKLARGCKPDLDCIAKPKIAL